MNAFRDLISGVGKAADVVLLGGAVGKSNRRNKFADLLESGNYDEAAQFAARHGEGAYAQFAQERGAISAQEAAAEQKRQQEQFKYIQNSAAFLDSLTPDLQKAYLDLNGPALVEQGVLDEEDLPILYQNVGVPAGFTGLARSAIDPNQQQQNIFEGQTIQETARSNRATEGLRGAEISLSQQRLGLDRERLGEDRRQFDATQAATIQKTTADATEKADALAGAIAARGQRVELISSKFDEAIAQVRGGLDGTAGRNAPFAVIPGTQAKNLDATLDTIKANIGFEELQRMRDNSPTGGALGQITEKEIAFLQAVLGSFDQGQSPDQLSANLVKAKADIIASWERVRRAYEQDFGVPYQGPGASLSSGSDQSAAPQQTDVDTLLKKYGVQ